MHKVLALVLAGSVSEYNTWARYNPDRVKYSLYVRDVWQLRGLNPADVEIVRIGRWQTHYTLDVVQTVMVLERESLRLRRLASLDQKQLPPDV